MSTAQQWFIVYGAVILGVGFLLGGILGLVRSKQPAARNLATAHVETLLQACVHLGLAFAIGAVGFDSDAATVGAFLLVVGSALQAAGVTLNWLTNTGDQFAERSPGFMLNSASALAAMPGMVIIVVGILTNV